MAWAKLDDGMPTHPKVIAAGAVAFALDVAAICYANKHLTDGHIPTHSLPAVLPGLPSPKRHAAKLVEVGRWEAVDGGWRIHDYHDFQPTAEHQREVSKKRADAGRRGGRRSGSKQPAKDEATSEANDKQSASKLLKPVPARPDPTPEQEPIAPAKPTRKPRKPDQIWDAVIEACGINPAEMTKGMRGSANNAVKQLKDIDATPEQIRVRGKRHLEKWPNVTLTPSSLAKNWPLLVDDPPAAASGGWR